MPAEVEKMTVTVTGPCLVPTTWRYLGMVWTPHGPVQTFLRPVVPLPMELVQASERGEA